MICNSYKYNIRYLCNRTLVILLVLLLVLSPHEIFAQFKSSGNRSHKAKHKLFNNNLVLSGNLYYGFIANHHIGMEIYNSHFPSIEISLIKATYGKKLWEQMYGYPWIGLTYWFSGLGYSTYLGEAHALMPHISFPLESTRKLDLELRIAAGIGYLSKKFDRLKNYKHLAIGTHLNFAGNIMFNLRYRHTPRLFFTSGISLTHFSNGSFKLPNYGINIPALHAGAAYLLNKPNRYIERRLYDPTKPFEFDLFHVLEFDFVGVIGFKNLEAIFGKKFLTYSLYGNIRKQISFKSKMGIGWDISYDDSDYKMLEQRHIPVPNKYSLVKTGISFSYGLTLNRLDIDFNYGLYIYFNDIDKSDGVFYHKVGLKYHITDHVFANIALKTHWGKADYIGWGIGYRFKFIY